MAPSTQGARWEGHLREAELLDGPSEARRITDGPYVLAMATDGSPGAAGRARRGETAFSRWALDRCCPRLAKWVKTVTDAIAGRPASPPDPATPPLLRLGGCHWATPRPGPLAPFTRAQTPTRQPGAHSRWHRWARASAPCARSARGHGLPHCTEHGLKAPRGRVRWSPLPQPAPSTTPHAGNKTTDYSGTASSPGGAARRDGPGLIAGGNNSSRTRTQTVHRDGAAGGDGACRDGHAALGYTRQRVRRAPGGGTFECHVFHTLCEPLAAPAAANHAPIKPPAAAADSPAEASGAVGPNRGGDFQSTQDGERQQAFARLERIHMPGDAAPPGKSETGRPARGCAFERAPRPRAGGAPCAGRFVAAAGGGWRAWGKGSCCS